MQILIAIIFGSALTVAIYETYHEKKKQKIQYLLAPKIEKLVEESSMKIAQRQSQLKRELTDEEKNKISDDCYMQL